MLPSRPRLGCPWSLERALVVAIGQSLLPARGQGIGGDRPDVSRTGGDPACFRGDRTPALCCGHAPHTGCQWGALLSHGYCCEPDSECYAWGTPVVGDDVSEPLPARTGLECRQLCQAEPACQAWTFFLPDFREPGLHYSCWLKARGWDVVEGSSRVAGVLSGTRHCPVAHGDILLDMRYHRTMDLDQEPGGGVMRPWLHPQSYALSAAELLRRHGWVVVRGALAGQQADALRAASGALEQQLLDRDPGRVGNRGPRRYSLGSASRTHHLAHLPEWAALIDVPIISSILRRVFEDDYVAIGGGGDIVLPRTDSVQWLHVDLPRLEMYQRVSPPPGVGVNFAVHDISCQDGPMRLVPDTHTVPFQLHEMMPARESDLLDRYGLHRVLVCPMQKGDAVLRDLRLWHAGSANHGPHTRHFPNAEYLATWYADLTVGTSDHLAPRPALPEELWQALSSHGKQVSRRTLASGALDTGLLDSIALPQQYD